ncbi:MAG: hypothetical protein PHW02_02425 [bacterium]|nr:hypothetical protein [bacterium]
MKKGKFTILLISGIAIILVLMSVIVFALAPKPAKADTSGIKEKLTEERNNAAVNLASVIASASLEPLLDEDEGPIMEMIIATVENSKGMIDYIYVIDTENNIWGDSKNPTNVSKPFNDKRIKTLTNEDRLIQNVDDNLFDAGVPIRTGTKKRGEVHLGMKKVSDVQTPQQSGTSPVIGVAASFGVGIVGAIILAIVMSNMLGGAGGDFASLRSAKIEELRKQEDDAQRSCNKKLEEVKKAEQKLDEINKKIKETGSRYDEVDKIIRESDQEISEKKKQIEFFENKINELTEKQKSLKDNIDRAKSGDVSTEELKMVKNQVDTFRLQLQQIMSDIESKRNEENSLNQRIQQLKSQSAQLSSASPSGQGAVNTAELEQKRKEEIEITQRIVAKRKEEIALSQRVELKRKKELELTGRIEMLEKKLKEMGNG